MAINSGFRCMAKPCATESGTITTLRGTVQDITERKSAEQNIAKLHQQMEEQVRTLERHDEQMRTIARMSDLLQACHDRSEAFPIICGDRADAVPPGERRHRPRHRTARTSSKPWRNGAPTRTWRANSRSTIAGRCAPGGATR